MSEDLHQQNTKLRRLVTDYHRRIVLLSKSLKETLVELGHIRKNHPSKYDKSDTEIDGADILKTQGAK